MMKKRSTAILLALCLAFSLAACSSGGSGASSQTQEPSQAAEPSAVESTETPAQPDETTAGEEPAEDPNGSADVVQPNEAATIAFDVDHTNKNENGAVLGTATVPADGYYLFAARTAPMYEDAEVTIATDLPLPMDAATVPAEAFTNGYDLYAMMELTAGDYTVAVGNAMYAIDLIPVQTVDSLAGAFARGGVYLCRLTAPVTVTFSQSDKVFVQFYGGDENTFLQMLEPTEASAVEFPAGIAIIDTHDHYETLIGTES